MLYPVNNHIQHAVVQTRGIIPQVGQIAKHKQNKRATLKYGMYSESKMQERPSLRFTLLPCFKSVLVRLLRLQSFDTAHTVKMPIVTVDLRHLARLHVGNRQSVHEIHGGGGVQIKRPQEKRAIG